METIGLKAVFEDADFQAGLKRYVDAQKQMERVTTQATQAIGVAWNEAAKRWTDANGKFVSGAEVSRRLDELKAKFPPVADAASKAGNDIARTGNAAQVAAGQLGFLGHTLSTALGNAITGIVSRGMSMIGSTLSAPLAALQSWGGGVHELGESFGMTDENAAGFAAAMKHVGMTVDEGAAGIGYFIRQLQTTKDQFANAAETYSTATRDIASAHADAINKINRDWQQAQADAAESIATVWQDFADKRTEIEIGLAENIQNIQEGLQERLADFADQRAELQKDTAKSLAKLEDDTKDKLRGAHSARERRQIKKDAAEQRQAILEQAAERERQIAKQEAREQRQAEKQIALAEKVAQKQIDAAEKASDKQVAATEKALAKQQKAMQEQVADADKAAAKQAAAASKALSDVTTKSPLSKALSQLGLTLKDVTNEAGDFTEEGLNKIMDAFAKLPAGVKSSAIAMQLFGKSGRDWMEFLRLGSQGLDDWKKKALALGLGVQTDEVKAYKRALADLDISILGLQVSIGNALLPMMSQLATALQSGLQMVMPLITDLTTRMREGYTKNGLQGMIDGMKAWAADSKNQAQIQAILQSISDMMQIVLSGLVQVPGFVGGILGPMFNAIRSWANGEDGKGMIYATMFNLGGLIVDALTMFVSTAATVGGMLAAMGAEMVAWLGTDDGKAMIKGIAVAFSNGFSAAMAEVNPFKGLPGYGKENAPGMGFAEGGWVPRTGPAMVHAGEYVLNRQQAMAWAPVLSRPNATTYNNNFYHTWPASVPPSQREWTEGMVRRVTQEEVRGILGRG